MRQRTSASTSSNSGVSACPSPPTSRTRRRICPPTRAEHPGAPTRKETHNPQATHPCQARAGTVTLRRGQAAMEARREVNPQSPARTPPSPHRLKEQLKLQKSHSRPFWNKHSTQLSTCTMHSAPSPSLRRADSHHGILCINREQKRSLPVSVSGSFLPFFSQPVVFDTVSHHIFGSAISMILLGPGISLSLSLLLLLLLLPGLSLSYPPPAAPIFTPGTLSQKYTRQ